jgi:hypothetical protein
VQVIEFAGITGLSCFAEMRKGGILFLELQKNGV